MEAEDYLYADAMQQTMLARKYVNNAEYWKILLYTLKEERKENLSQYGWIEYQLLAHDFRTKINRNLRMATRINRTAYRILKKYTKVKAKEVLDDRGGEPPDA
jgi:hypothetical protein